MTRPFRRSDERAREQVEEIRSLGALLDTADDLDPLLERVGDARIVQIGEASHGTSDYYRWRAELTRRLVDEHGFSFVAVEGDWPDCAAVGDDGRPGEFSARQNAEVVAGAERYYRTMVRGGGQSWNVRDVHMADTLDRLLEHHGPDARGIVWAHNTHVGDARATDMASAGMVNLGQLARERHGDDAVVLVGFGSRRGTVIAGDHWGAPARALTVPDAPAGSHEDLLHRALGDRGLIVMPDRATRERHGLTWPDTWRGHRAIGVVYHPSRDPLGNWVPTVIGDRYDAFCHLDTTEALSPLLPAMVSEGEPETYPWTT